MSIRNYIVRTDINEANENETPKIKTSCSSCRNTHAEKTYHLINSDKTLEDKHNGNELKKLDGGNGRTASIVYTARSKIHWDIYIGNSAEELRESQQTQQRC